MKKGGGVFLILILTLILSVSTSFALELRVTPGHPFFVNGNWVRAGELEIGDVLIRDDGSKVRVTGIEDVNSPVAVYNIAVLGLENYFANRVLVHNKPMRTDASLDSPPMNPQSFSTSTGDIVEVAIDKAQLPEQFRANAFSRETVKGVVTNVDFDGSRTVKIVMFDADGAPVNFDVVAPQRDVLPIASVGERVGLGDGRTGTYRGFSSVTGKINLEGIIDSKGTLVSERITTTPFFTSRTAQCCNLLESVPPLDLPETVPVNVADIKNAVSSAEISTFSQISRTGASRTYTLDMIDKSNGKNMGALSMHQHLSSNGEVVGEIGVFISDGIVDNVRVGPNFKGKGIGSKLIYEADRLGLFNQLTKFRSILVQDNDFNFKKIYYAKMTAPVPEGGIAITHEQALMETAVEYPTGRPLSRLGFKPVRVDVLWEVSDEGTVRIEWDPPCKK